jgi:hypothetical protein
MISLLALLSAPAAAGDFMDIWVTTALEDDNVRAGSGDYSPSANFVARGNRTFFEDYEARYSDDISQSHLVLYRRDDGYSENWYTETAMVLQFRPYLDPDQSTDGVDLSDDGSYVRVVRELEGEDHTVSLTGYAIDASRFRLGYSYDLSYGGKEIMSRPVWAMPGARLQWQKGGTYVFAGAKSAIGPRTEVAWEGDRNASYYGMLAGAGTRVGNALLLEGGFGLFQQGQMENVPDAGSPLYGEIIRAMGTSAQVGWRTSDNIDFIQSAELRLYRNAPEHMRDSYITHTTSDGVDVLVQAEANYLTHNLLDADNTDQTTLESALAADVQTVIAFGDMSLNLDAVYKDLAYILFNIPGLTSGTSLPNDLVTTPQLYGRVRFSHYLPAYHTAWTVGGGMMQPATYTTEDGGTFVQYTERDKEGVPTDQEAASNILAGLLGLQVDLSKSMVAIGELLYTMDNNLSRVQANDSGELVRVAESDAVRQALGFNLMLRARF